MEDWLEITVTHRVRVRWCDGSETCVEGDDLDQLVAAALAERG